MINESYFWYIKTKNKKDKTKRTRSLYHLFYFVNQYLAVGRVANGQHSNAAMLPFDCISAMTHAF